MQGPAAAAPTRARATALVRSLLGQRAQVNLGPSREVSHMKRSFGFLAEGVLALSLVVATTQHAAASCATDDPDGSKRATARASAEQACTDAGNGCTNALNHGA